MIKPKKPSAQHGASFAKGGSTRMMKPQAAGPAKAGQTGKPANTAPGSRYASGGPARTGRSVSVPAAAGRTGKRT
jgi:hypothetical protein